MTAITEKKTMNTEIDPKVHEGLVRVRDMVQSCIQCGTCTGSCPNEFAMDLTPRMLWRLILGGYEEDVFHSKTFSLCSFCYNCTLRCPRNLPLTEAMAALKQIAAQGNLGPYRQGNKFYNCFLKSVRRHGRVEEMEFMTYYFIARMNPILPLKYASLGLKLMGKGKVMPKIPSLGGKSVLESIFVRVEEMEARK